MRRKDSDIWTILLNAGTKHYPFAIQVALLASLLWGVSIHALPSEITKQVVVGGVQAKAEVSSELASKKDPGRYSVVNLFDGDPRTAWCEGSATDGVLEEITVHFLEPQLLSSLHLVNGYRRNQATYSENNRIGRFSVLLDGEALPLFSSLSVAKDEMTEIQIHQYAKSITIKVGAVNKGTKYNDLCVSELSIIVEQVEGKQWAECENIIQSVTGEWAYCLPGTPLETIRFFGIEGVSEYSIPRELLGQELVHWRLERVPDIAEGMFVFRIIAQYPYDREQILHFISERGESLLIFHEKSFGVDGGFDYVMEASDINKDGLVDLSFKGECDYPDDCPHFQTLIHYLSDKGRYFYSRIVE